MKTNETEMPETELQSIEDADLSEAAGGRLVIEAKGTAGLPKGYHYKNGGWQKPPGYKAGDGAPSRGGIGRSNRNFGH